MKKHFQEWNIIAALLLLIPFCGFAQNQFNARNGKSAKTNGVPTTQAFTFVRVEWQSVRFNSGRRGFGRGPFWAHDYPTAEHNLYIAIDALTSLPLTFENKVLTLNDEEIFNYPFLYICEVGYWGPSEDEAKTLQEYLNRGGFLLVDDFRGGFEWRNFVQQMQRVTPHKPRLLSMEHPIFHCFFDFNELGVHSPYWGMTPQYYAIFDADDRMMVLINYNNDIGDGWEWPESYQDFSTEAFKLAVNYLVYSMTH